MRVGIAADHGGFEMKMCLTTALKAAGYEVVDFGAHELVTGDDYPDFVVPWPGRWQAVRSLGAWPSVAAGSGLALLPIRCPACVRL